MPMPRGTNASKDKCLDLWVQAFVLAFVRTKCGCRHLSSWHLSEPKVGPGIFGKNDYVIYGRQVPMLDFRMQEY